jgi:hypothetical protein
VRRSVWFWLLVAVVIVLLLGLLFGGYRKGTQVSGLPAPVAATGAGWAAASNILSR